MAKKIRAFIAIKIPPTPPLRKVISSLSHLGRAVKTVESESLHITLKFFGDIEPEAIPNIATTLGSVAETTNPFVLRIAGLGVFPHLRRPSVIWADLKQAEPLIQLAELLELSLSTLGYHPESRGFRPHLTLARIKSKPPAEFFELLEQHETTDFGLAQIKSIQLLQSELKPQGPRYITLAEFSLNEETGIVLE